MPLAFEITEVNELFDIQFIVCFSPELCLIDWILL
jgi:hypothetical protein